MSRLALLIAIILPSLSPVSLRAASPLPICAADEFLTAFHQIVEHQVLFDEKIAAVDDLARFGEITLGMRQELAQLPDCAEAIAIQRLLIQLGGDALARAALELAGLPADENPYFLRLPDDQTRIEDLLAAMLSVERSEALPAGERELPACQPEDWSPLDEGAAALLNLAEARSAETSPVEALAAIDRRLRWREESINALPDCAESIDLIHAISAAASDSAAALAFDYANLPAELNPFPPLLEASLAAIRSWREQHSLKAASHIPSPAPSHFGARQLPACADSTPFGSPAELRSEIAALIEDADSADSSADLADFAYDQISFRKARLAPLPHCAEAFDLRWWTAEALADAALRSAIDVGAPPSIAPGLRPAQANIAARAAASWARLDRLPARATPPAIDERAPECADADHVFFFAYLAPEFWRLTDAFLAISLPQEIPAFIEGSYAFRQLLWENLPRCADALEMGLLMRAAAADAAALLALEMAKASIWDLPYLPKVAGDIEAFFALAEEIVSPCGNLDGDAKTYYVVADNIANIRACASINCEIVTTASRGQRLDVIEDRSNWYEIILPNCETAFIAGFLASQTPPAR